EINVIGLEYVRGVGTDVAYIQRYIVRKGVLHVQIPEVIGKELQIKIAAGTGACRRIGAEAVSALSNGVEHRNRAGTPRKRRGYDPICSTGLRRDKHAGDIPNGIGRSLYDIARRVEECGARGFAAVVLVGP